LIVFAGRLHSSSAACTVMQASLGSAQASDHHLAVGCQLPGAAERPVRLSAAKPFLGFSNPLLG
jgi:hypothetical protein